jgi:hypothetical protein
MEKKMRVTILILVLVLFHPFLAIAEEDAKSGNYWFRVCQDDRAGLCAGFFGGMVGMNDLNLADGQLAY